MPTSDEAAADLCLFCDGDGWYIANAFHGDWRIDAAAERQPCPYCNPKEESAFVVEARHEVAIGRFLAALYREWGWEQ